MVDIALNATKAKALITNLSKSMTGFNLSESRIDIIVLVVFAFVLIGLIIWNSGRLGMMENSRKKLEKLYPNPTNESYFNGPNNIKPSAIPLFDNSNSTLINYYVKSAYNCCCGDGYRNNFVDLYALEKVIGNGCRFLDFEVYSYNNDPIVASSTANSNNIKETYNALLLKDVLTKTTETAFDETKTICANDPLILNFRIMSTNLTMLEKIGDLFEEYLDRSINSNFSLLKGYKDSAIKNVKMKDLYRKIIIICDFNPNPNIIINTKLEKLAKYINLKGKGLDCKTYRYDDIVAKGQNNINFIQETQRYFTIVLPNVLDNSIDNFDYSISYTSGCHAICMKHQNLDTNLQTYNGIFSGTNKFSWKQKDQALLNIAPDPINTSQGVDINTPPLNGTSSAVNNALTGG
jgi:hypothetical protein